MLKRTGLFPHPSNKRLGIDAFSEEEWWYAKMSFGFGVGDFIAVAELAAKIREGFVGAPHQFKAIADE